jgi:hypothetical protein
MRYERAVDTATEFAAVNRLNEAATGVEFFEQPIFPHLPLLGDLGIRWCGQPVGVST